MEKQKRNKAIALLFLLKVNNGMTENNLDEYADMFLEYANKLEK